MVNDIIMSFNNNLNVEKVLLNVSRFFFQQCISAILIYKEGSLKSIIIGNETNRVGFEITTNMYNLHCR